MDSFHKNKLVFKAAANIGIALRTGGIQALSLLVDARRAVSRRAVPGRERKLPQEGRWGKRISRGRKQDTEAKSLVSVTFRRPGGRYTRS